MFIRCFLILVALSHFSFWPCFSGQAEGAEKGALRLPESSVVIDQEVGNWDRYQWPVLATAAVLVAQALFIVTLLVRRHRRRRIGNEFARLEQRYQNLLNNTSEQMWCIEFDEPVSLDLPEAEQVERLFDARVVEANAAFAKAYGATLDEVLQWRISDFIPRDYPTSAPLLLEAVRSGYRMENLETTEQAVDGHIKIFVNKFNGTIENDHVIRIWGMCRDVTETREIEKQISLRQTAIDSSDDAFSVASAESDFPLVYVNQRFCDLTGYTQEEVLGRNCRFLQGENTNPATVRQMRSALKEHQKFRGEILNYRKDGMPFWNSLRLSPVFDDNKTLTHFVGIQTDITARKHNEELIVQQRRDLAHVSRLTALGEIGAALAHELKQPMASILLNAEAASRMLQNGSQDLDQFRDIVADIIRDDRRAGKVLDRIRHYLQKEEQPHQVLSINEVIDESLTLLEKELVSHHLKVNISLAPDLPPVIGDPIELQQVIINQVLNAEQAMQGQNERKLTIKSFLDKNQHIRIEICDNGPGIHARDLERIFTAFHTTKKGGMGMGLAINRTIINSHGGRIWTEKNRSQGARFIITLPPEQVTNQEDPDD